MKPQVKYDADANAAYIQLAAGKIVESEEVTPVFDFDASGHIVGIEILNARTQLTAEMLGEAA
ncbi:MAG: DUF2283 domain-containing protein [Rhizobiaceae bacterium]